MPPFFEFLVSVIKHYHIYGLHQLWDSFEWFCLQISSHAKYFSSLVQGIVIDDKYLLLYTIFESETKNNTTLLVVELLAVTWVPWLLKHPILFPNV